MTRLHAFARGARHANRQDSFYALVLAWSLALLSGVGAIKARMRNR